MSVRWDLAGMFPVSAIMEKLTWIFLLPGRIFIPRCWIINTSEVPGREFRRVMWLRWSAECLECRKVGRKNARDVEE